MAQAGFSAASEAETDSLIGACAPEYHSHSARGISTRAGFCFSEGGCQVTCAFPHCRQEGSLIYLQREICPRHWNELAAADPAAELELLSKIDLTRTAQGEVVEVAVG